MLSKHCKNHFKLQHTVIIPLSRSFILNISLFTMSKCRCLWFYHDFQLRTFLTKSTEPTTYSMHSILTAFERYYFNSIFLWQFAFFFAVFLISHRRFSFISVGCHSQMSHVVSWVHRCFRARGIIPRKICRVRILYYCFNLAYMFYCIYIIPMQCNAMPFHCAVLMFIPICIQIIFHTNQVVNELAKRAELESLLRMHSMLRQQAL